MPGRPTALTAQTLPEPRARRRALHDPLTGLPNRAMLGDRLDRAIADAVPRSLALLFLDIDASRAVSARFGRPTGDDFVRWAAKQLTSSVRAVDTVVRWSGDEFLVVAERLDVHVSANALAGRLTASLAAPFTVGADRIRVNAFVGIAHLEPRQSADQLVLAADRALRASRSGQMNRWGGIAG